MEQGAAMGQVSLLLPFTSLRESPSKSKGEILPAEVVQDRGDHPSTFT